MTKISFFALILFVAFFTIPQPVEALTRASTPNLVWGQAQKAPLLQQIEILRFEIQLLQSLLFNMQKQQEITAGAFVAVNVSDNSVVLEKNADQSYPIASITKLMTAVIALENAEKGRRITLTEKMLEPLGYSPSLFLGLNVSFENLLKASLIQSTNDAAVSLTYFLGKEKFLELMNKEAKELGMKNTFFADTHGLSLANRSTAADLAKLITHIYQKHPEILEITRNNDFWLPDETGRLLKFRNVNNFYPLRQFIGGKTGYLPQAKQTLASVFRVNETPVVIVLLYSDDRQADVFTILKLLQSAVRP